MNIIIVSEESFFNGTGQENRQLSYAKGIAELSHSVKILTLFQTEQSNCTKTLDTIRIEYLRGGYKKSSYIPTKIKALKFYLNFFLIIYQENRKKKVDCILMQSFSNTPAFFLYIVTRIFTIKYIRDQTEYPFVHKSAFGRVRLYLYNNYFFKLFDALVVINDELLAYFKNRIRGKAKMMKFPMIVDPGRFENIESRRDCDYLAYCGDMRNNKDGIPILIDAFKLVTGKYRNLKLYLIGDIDGVIEVEGFKQKIQLLGLSEKVVFTGRISRDEMPQYLCNATLLVLSRPDNKQAKGGFPTKLGEYLASGRPVIVTRVGEVPDYLTDEVNAFLSEPDNSEAFASRIIYALSNPGLAKRVGDNGKQLVNAVFNYKIQSQYLIDFINNMTYNV